MYKLILCAMLSAVLIAACDKQRSSDAGDRHARQNARQIADNLTSWARQNGGMYPQTLNVELLKNARNEALSNPYLFEEEVHPVAFTAQEKLVGNVCYIPVHEGLEVRGYILLAFGNDPEGGEDVDGDGEADNVLVLTTSNGVSREEALAFIREMK